MSEFQTQLLDAAYSRPRPKHKPVLARRLRKGRESRRPFWHVAIHTPTLTQEEAERVKEGFLRAQRSGVVVTNEKVRIERIPR